MLAAAGMVRVGLVALDGTRMKSNASHQANRTGEQLEEQIAAAEHAAAAEQATGERAGGHRAGAGAGAAAGGSAQDDIAEQVAAMLDEAEAVDAAEDAEHEDRRGDQPPAGLATGPDRLARLREAKSRLDQAAQDAQHGQDQRMRDWQTNRAAGQNTGRKPGPTPPKNDRSPRVNLTDPDSRIVKTRHGWVQGYNGQIVVGASQVIIAAQVHQSSDDSAALHPMLTAARTELDAAGITDPMRAAVADSGYGGKTNLSRSAEPILLIATGSGRRPPTPPNRTPAMPPWPTD